MFRTFPMAAVLLWALPWTASAQTFSQEEQEVWGALKSCVETFAREELEAGYACTHEDFVGWSLDQPVQRTKGSDIAGTEAFCETRDVLSVELRPLAINVFGNTAILHYYGFWAMVGEDGQEGSQTTRWTDIMIKENGKWMWVADHGGVIGGY